MRILHIIPSLRKGGAERLALDICIELSKRNGVEVALVALHKENAYQSLSNQINFHVIEAKYIPSLSGKASVKVDALMHFIREFKPDVIHSHLFEAEMASRCKLVDGVKYFTHCHDNMHQLKKFSWKTLFNKKLLTEFYERYLILRQYKKCNNSFVAISTHTQQYFFQNLPKTFQHRIHLQHNAIHFEQFHAVYSPRKTMPLKLINAGSFVAKKNQQFLVDVMLSLVTKAYGVDLILLGDGSLRNSVIDKVKSLGLESKIHLPGNVEDVPTYLSQASIYVHSATYEPFGLVLIEAMAAGLPVVCLDGGGNRDIIEQNKNGIMIYEQNAEAFANAILQIANNEELYRKMSNYAVNFARGFDIKPYVDKLLNLYAS